MQFYIHVHSGLNNKLIPLISLLRIAKKEGEIIKCFWGYELSYVGQKIIYNFTDLFEDIQQIQFITHKEFSNELSNSNNTIYNKSGSDRNYANNIIYCNGTGNSVFNKIVHLITYKSDNIINKYIPYPCKTLTIDSVIEEIRDVIKYLKPKKSILDKIDSDFFQKNKTIGIHIRTADGGFKLTPKYKVFDFLSTYLKKNPTYKIYLSCDDSVFEKKIIEKYGDKVNYLKEPFGNTYQDKFDRNTFGIKNAVCEMFSLSRCTEFFGTPSSSFSFMVWLLRNDKQLNFWY